jgi:hypothetical protein
MKFWYKGKKWQPIVSYRFITRGARKGQIEVTFRKYGKEVKEVVYPSQTRGLPEYKTQEEESFDAALQKALKSKRRII